MHCRAVPRLPSQIRQRCGGLAIDFLRTRKGLRSHRSDLHQLDNRAMEGCMSTMRFPALRIAGIIVCSASALIICAEAENNRATASPQKKHVVIAAKMLFDGRGNVLRDTRIVVEG